MDDSASFSPGHYDGATSGAEATMPPPVQLTKRFQEPINYDSTLEMPSPPISPLKPYSYPSPSPPLEQKFSKLAEAINYPNVKYYQNHGFSVADYSTERDATQERRDTSFANPNGIKMSRWPDDIWCQQPSIRTQT